MRDNQEAKTPGAGRVVVCKICQESLVLNEDSEQAREQATDPRQQLRTHLLQHGATGAALLTYTVAWLTDTLAFECPNDDAGWREEQIKTFDWVRKRGIGCHLFFGDFVSNPVGKG